MKAAEIAEKAIATFNKRITDEIFLTIQNDPILMKEYLRVVEVEGLDHVNKTIGKTVKIKYGLCNIKERETIPSSTLIKSCQKFK